MKRHTYNIRGKENLNLNLSVNKVKCMFLNGKEKLFPFLFCNFLNYVFQNWQEKIAKYQQKKYKTLKLLEV